MKMSEKLYHRYEYLAKKYASKIFSYEELSFEFEDLVQEFRLKIFTSIKSYGRRWAKYRRNEASKPVPIRFYLEAACSNKSRDFMKYISRENYKTRIDEINFDYGIEGDTQIIPGTNKFVLNGVDLLEGLTGKERVIFSLFLRGYNTKILNKVYFNNESEKRARKEILDSGDEPIGVADIIDLQKSYLIQKYGNELLQQKKVFSSYSFDEE
nr:MAG TPA: RNA polymerase sigma factor [Caudoviricetes sp.]